jgi:hypothetical protein
MYLMFATFVLGILLCNDIRIEVVLYSLHNCIVETFIGFKCFKYTPQDNHKSKHVVYL